MRDLETVGSDGQAVTVSDDATKANVLNSFFAKQTHLTSTPSTFPDFSDVYKDGAVADALSTTPAEFSTLCATLIPARRLVWMRFH